MTQRLVKHPFLAIFDGPDTNASTDVRSRSTVPLQALYLLNNPFVQEQAAGFADRLIAGSRDDRARIELAYAAGLGPAARARRGRSRAPLSDRLQEGPCRVARCRAQPRAASPGRAWPRSC